jgi:hypothetical protein
MYPSPLARRRLRRGRLQACTRLTARWTTFAPFSTRPTPAACASSPNWWSTTPPTSTPGSRRPAPTAQGLYRDFYVWSDDPKLYSGTRIIFTDTEKSNWTWDEVAGQYFWHRFFSHQPDLNFDNPAVLRRCSM